MTPLARILVAGIGNVFMGDDGFGVEVVRRLRGRPLAREVEIVDFGIRGHDLAFTLLEGVHDLIVLVDAVERRGAPGTVYLIEPEVEAMTAEEADDAAFATHGMHPEAVLRWAAARGARPRRVRVVGCEPAVIGTEAELVMGLSPSVEAAVGGAIEVIETLIERTLSEKGAV